MPNAVDDVLKPYQGPPPTPQNFAEVYPQYETAIKKGVQNLDPESQQNKLEVEHQLRMNRPKPATVINLHPWPLTIATNRFTRGLTIPACEPGMLFAHFHIRRTPLDWKYDENGSLKFQPVLPIRIAAEFLQVFSSNDGYGCGVIIYEGDSHPDKTVDIETYDPRGRPLTISRKEWELDEDQNRVPITVEIPIKKKLLELLRGQRELRNRIYMERVRKADHDYKLPDGRGKWLINDTHLKMAEVMHAEGLIPVMPEWNLASRLEMALGAGEDGAVCPACGAIRKPGAFKCAGCGHVLNALEAYKNAAIEYGHVSFELMSSDELEQAEEIRSQREQTKKAFRAKMKAQRDEAKPE